MTTRLVMIPASWQMSREAAFLAQSTGELSQIRSRNAQEQTEALDDLNELLDEGYTVISQTLISGGQRDLITLILYKPAEKPIGERLLGERPISESHATYLQPRTRT